MCSFLIFNFIIEMFKITKANNLLKLRGPDLTNKYEYNKFTFIHNLLHITGTMVPQPFVQDKIICLYNGEIYNYKELLPELNLNSDGECLIPMYLKYGINFAKHLDGEFAICLFDFNLNIAYLASDTFGTKPFFYAINGKNIGIASYSSALRHIGIKNILRVPPNSILEIDLNNLQIKRKKELYKFDLNQHKNHYNDFIKALKNSVNKRCLNTNAKIYVPLSSGYDSGLICGILNELAHNYNTISLDNHRENMNCIKKRIELNKHNNNHIIKSNHIIQFQCKNIVEKIYENNINLYSAVYASTQLTMFANKQKYKICLSGCGVDEIISDYCGGKICGNFGAKFPLNLKTIFPKNSSDNNCVWKNFYNGVQKGNLLREEVICGTFGIESRYPFLDKEVVQEFLWLSQKLKMKKYKAPLFEYLIKLKYPFVPNKKVGYST